MSRDTPPADVLAGRARWSVVHGDNRDVLPTLPAKSVAHVITDPPYSEHVHSKQRRVLRGSGGRVADGQAARRGIAFVPLGFDALTEQGRLFYCDCFAELTQRWCLVFSDLENTEEWLRELVVSGLRRWRFGVWNKLNCPPQLSGTGPAAGSEGIAIAHSKKAMRWNGGGLPARFDFAIATDRNGTGDRVHTTQKPIDLMLRLVELFTDPDDIVLDPFAGSGTTGVACLRLGRRFVGIEKDAAYAQAARDRLAAEVDGLSLRDARAGQQPLFPGGTQ